jgi:hypothetical protein
MPGHRRVRLFEIRPQRIVDDDGPAVRESFDRMAGATRHDGDHPRSRDLSHTVDGHLKLAIDHFIHFFLRMEMFVNGRAAHEVVMRECHARRVEIAPIPTRQALYDREAANVHKWHRNLLLGAC